MAYDDMNEQLWRLERKVAELEACLNGLLFRTKALESASGVDSANGASVDPGARQGLSCEEAVLDLFTGLRSAYGPP